MDMNEVEEQWDTTEVLYGMAVHHDSPKSCET